MASRSSRGPRIAGRAALAALLLLIGVWLGGHPSWIPPSIRGDFVAASSGQLVSDVLETISRDYYRPVDRTQLLNKGLVAMVDSLHDPYSHYYDPAAYRSFLSQSNPHLSGIGIDVMPDPAGLRVVDVFPGSPAAKAGLVHGDLITAVGGTSLAGRTAGFASSLIRGRPGTSVRLTIKSAGRIHEVTIVRQKIVIPVASDQLLRYRGVKIGYLRLTAFTSDAGSELRGDVQSVLRRGARALILDLRENGGGLLDQAVDVASIFIPDGTIVTTRGRNQPTQVYTAHGGAIATSIPLVVLVNHDTASAAEIVTAALQQRGRAKVVGTRTYGKGVFQEIEPLPGGGALDLTVGEYFTPNGTNLGGGGVREGRGIKPNIYVPEAFRSSRDAALGVAERTVAAEVK